MDNLFVWWLVSYAVCAGLTGWKYIQTSPFPPNRKFAFQQVLIGIVLSVFWPFWYLYCIATGSWPHCTKQNKTEEVWEPTTQPWIVCAANRYGDVIILGARHHDKLMRDGINRAGGWKYLLEQNKDALRSEEQGFIDQFGRFYNREEAFQLAVQNGQITPWANQYWLDSESLY